MTYPLLLAFLLFIPFQFALNPTAGVDLASIRICILGLFFIWTVESICKKKIDIPVNIAALSLYAFLFACLYSLLLAQNVLWGIRKFAFLLSFFPIFLIAYSTLNTEERMRKGIFFLILGASMLALIGIAQFLAQFIFGIAPLYSFWTETILPFFLGNNFSHAVATYPSLLVHIGSNDYFRAVSIFPDPHMLSFFLGITLPWAIVLAMKAKKYMFFYSSVASVILLCDLATFSRGGYLGILTCLLIIAPLALKKYRHASKTLLLSLLAISILISTENPLSSRIVSSLDMQDGSNTSRIAIWREGFNIFLSNPLGVGIGNYPLEVKPSAEYREPIYAHMLYLDIAAETGMFGLFFLLSFLLSTAISFYQKAKEDPYYIAGICSIVIYGAHSLVENAFFSVHALSLILIIGSIGARKNYEKRAN